MIIDIRPIEAKKSILLNEIKELEFDYDKKQMKAYKAQERLRLKKNELSDFLEFEKTIKFNNELESNS